MLIFSFFIIIFFTATQALITTPLLHHNSIHHPLYNESKNLRERAHFDLETSVMRASLVSPRHYQSPSIITSPASLQAGFLVQLQIGSKNLDQLVFIDTVSSLFWINCQPCGVFVTPPVFNPTTSSSYRIQQCLDDDEECDSTAEINVDCTNDHRRGPKDGCSFKVSYGDNIYSAGDLAVDNLRFQGGEQALERTTFGCAHDANLYGGNGMIGLGTTSSLSILKQHKLSTFSYCVGSINNRSYADNKLFLADNLNIMLGNVTPMSVGNDRYYLNLEAIRFNELPLDFDPGVLRRNPNISSGGMVVDVSSTYTFLPQVVYDKFAAVVDIALNSFVKNESFPYQGQSRLCYNGVSDRDLHTFPSVSLHFEGGAIMKLLTDHLFLQVSEDNFCLAVLPIDKFYPGSTVSILGNLMQQYLYIGFHLELRMVVFQSADCSLV